MAVALSLQERAQCMLIVRERQTSEVVEVPVSYANRYVNDPVGFVRDCFTWKPGEGATPYQNDIMQSLVDHRRVSVRGPHGLGKTALLAWLVHWFALTNDEAIDWKIPITASAWRQLTKYAMPEVHKWARRLNWSVLGRLPYNERLELTQQSLHLKTGEAFALASDNSTMIEGAHASKILYIFDESKEIPVATWDSAEGAFSIGDTYWASFSTPGEPAGRFYDIQARRPGYEDWHVRHVTREEVIAAGRMSREWASSRLRQWGETSAVYQNRVEGEFASSEADGVIPLTWVEKANERWEEWRDADPRPDLHFTSLGADIARSGEDKTVLALRFAMTITELRVTIKEDTMQTTGRIKGILDANKGGKALIDVIGIGAGVVDRLREMKYSEIIAFNASEHTDYMDSANELGFINCRSAAWWHLREMLDPSNGHDIALPPDDLLTGDLVSPHWKVTSGGKIQVEGKDDIKERIGRSTDYGDAVVMAFFDNNFLSLQSWTEALKRHTPEVKDTRGTGHGFTRRN
jgi:hypothetical protein